MKPNIVEVESHSSAIELLMSPKRYAYFYSKDILKYVLKEYKIESYYVCDNHNDDSVFTINLVAIAMRKGFPYESHFNQLWEWNSKKHF